MTRDGLTSGTGAPAAGHPETPDHRRTAMYLDLVVRERADQRLREAADAAQAARAARVVRVRRARRVRDSGLRARRALLIALAR